MSYGKVLMNDQDVLSQIAEQILNDAVLLRRLSDRVYELLKEETENQRDRLGRGRRT